MLLSVFICIYAGSLASAVIHYAQRGGKAGFKFYPAAAAAFVFLAAALFMSRKGWALENIMKRLMTLLGGFYAGQAREIKFYPMPSAADLDSAHHEWWHSAQAAYGS